MADIQEKFYQYYKSNIEANCQELEIERQKRFCDFAKLALTLLAPIFIYLCFNPLSILSAKVLMYFLIVWLICLYPMRTYQEEVKKIIMQKILNFWSDFEKQKELELTDNDILKSGLFGDNVHSLDDDIFTGKYKGIGVCISEKNIYKYIDRQKTASIESF